MNVKVLILSLVVLFFTTPLFVNAQETTDQELASEYYSNKEYSKAVVYYQKLFNKTPNQLFYSKLLNCFIELEEYKNGEKLVKKQIKNNPFDPSYNADLANLYKVSGKENDAKQTIDKAIKQLIPNQQVINELAMAFMRYQELDAALATYLHGRKLLKGSYPFNFELAQIYNLKGDTKAMIDEYIDILAYQELYIQSVQNALQTVLYPDDDGAKKSMLKTTLLKSIQRYPDKKVFSEMLIWVYIQEENYKGAMIQADKAINLLQETLKIPGLKAHDAAEAKIELADVYLFTGEIWEASLLYSQVEKAYKYDELGERAKFKNARISFYTGDFAWAKAQLNVLKASTSKLIANDAMQLSILITDNIGIDTTEAPLLIYAKADLLAYQNKYKEAMQVLDSLQTTFPLHTINDDILFKKFQINYELKNYEEAVKNLEAIVDDYGYDILADDAIYNLALMFDNILNQKERAQNLYKRLLFDFQDSIYGVDARKRYREMEKTNPEKENKEFEAN